MPRFKVLKRLSFFGDSAILGTTPNDEISESKKLLVLLSKRFLISGAILGSVINRLKWLLQIQLNSDLKSFVARDQAQTREHRKYV